MEDCRWIPDAREVVPGHDTLRPSVDPRNARIGKEVSLIVELNSGIIKAHMPCQNAQPRVFNQPSGFAGPRVMASEFYCDVEYPDEATTVKLAFSQLNPLEELQGLTVRELVLQFGRSQMIEVRVGNDTMDEIVEMRSPARCDIADLPNAPDNDFDLHYNLLTAGPIRPLPLNGPRTSEHNGCVGYMAKLPVRG